MIGERGTPAATTFRGVKTALTLALALTLVLPTTAQAQKPPTMTVMTRNVFLGADLSPAINAPDIPKAIDGAGTVLERAAGTKFAERAVPLAREIKASKADLVGLQEVALWRKQTPSDGGAPPISPMPGATPATAVEQDFLALLQAQLGYSYKVVVVQEEFDAELPVDADANDATGTGPLAAIGADFDARLTMRDVILVRKGSKVKVGKTRRPATSRPATSRTSAGSRSRSTAAGRRSRRSSASASSASSTPTWRRSATPRSARRRPRS